ncbi:MAG TPA: NAD-dependent epimerase/dehydratase family protein [Candidatus Acidoferrales bacterium]|nr:NAD-dependent epimerase/dehydratase family protein [Candidatus Acidoferrales bacterium]
MKALFIGGTGNISTSVSRLCIGRGIDLHLLNRGKRKVKIPGAKLIKVDISNPSALNSVLKKHEWDVVVDWIAFNPDQVERDIELFRGKTKQYVFISSASAYQKPPSFPIITESTPLCNPFWEYSRNKIACEEKLNRAYREEGFPATIVRPSFTYDTVIPLAIGGWDEYTVIDRMKKGRKVIVHGDGTSLWTITHAEDFAKGFVGLLGNQRAVGHPFQITSDEALTWDQIYRTTADAFDVEAQIVHISSDFICRLDKSMIGTLLGDKSHCAIFDNTKIKTFVPDFKATIPFNEGVRKTLAWFDADPKRKIVRAETNEKIDRIIEAYERNSF